MNLNVDPEQGHGDSLICLALVTKATTDFRPAAAKAGLLDDSSDHLHMDTYLFSEKTPVPQPHPIYGRS